MAKSGNALQSVRRMMPRLNLGPIEERWGLNELARIGTLAAIGILWIPQMFRAFWLDELGSYWVLEGSLAQTWTRAWEVQGQSPLTYVLMWFGKEVIGTAEWQLRALPIAFGIAAVLIVPAIAKRLGLSDVRWVAALTLSLLPEFVSVATQFRPYAFGLFFIALSTHLLIRWFDTRSLGAGLAYVLSAAAVVWSHYYLVFAVLAHVVWLAYRVARSEMKGRSLIAILGGLALFTAPLLPQVLALAGRRDLLRFSSGVPFPLLGYTLAPPGVVLGAIVGLMVGGVRHWKRPPMRPGSLAFLLSITVVPVACVTFLSGLSTFLPYGTRYLSSVFYGLALIVSFLFAGIVGQRSRLVVLFLIIAVGIAFGAAGLDSPRGDGYRGAAQFVAENAPHDAVVIYNAGFVESQDRKRVDDSQRDDFLFAPLTLYPVPQERVVLARWSNSDTEAGSIATELAERFSDSESIVVMYGGYPFFVPLMTAVLEQRGYASLPTPDFDGIGVGIYRRDRG